MYKYTYHFMQNAFGFYHGPLVQKESDVFRETVWNTHRIQAQKDTVLPDRIPDHIYNFPEQYDLEDCGRWYTPCLC